MDRYDENRKTEQRFSSKKKLGFWSVHRCIFTRERPVAGQRDAIESNVPYSSTSIWLVGDEWTLIYEMKIRNWVFHGFSFKFITSHSICVRAKSASSKSRDRFDIWSLRCVWVCCASSFAWLHAFRSLRHCVATKPLQLRHQLYSNRWLIRRNIFRNTLPLPTRRQCGNFRFYEFRWWKITGHRLRTIRVLNFQDFVFHRARSHILNSRPQNTTLPSSMCAVLDACVFVCVTMERVMNKRWNYECNNSSDHGTNNKAKKKSTNLLKP